MIQLQNTIQESGNLSISRYDISVYLGYIGYAAGTAVIPMILLPMSQELGFHLSSGGIIHLIRGLVMVVSMALSGCVSNRLGKTGALSLSLLLIGIGLFICSGVSAFASIIAGIVLIGFGNGLFDSLATGYTQDLHALSNAGRYINITHSFWPAGTLICVLCAGFGLGHGYSWRTILVITGILLTFFSILFFVDSLHNRGRRIELLPVKQLIVPLKNARFWLILWMLFLNSGSEHCLSFWTPSFISLEIGGQNVLCGTAVACFSLGMFVGRAGCGIFRSSHSYGFISCCTAFCAIVSLTIPLISAPWLMLTVLFSLGAATGPLWPSLQYYCVSNLKCYSPTALYILMPLFGIPGCGIMTYLLGLLGDSIGLRKAFFVVPFCNIVIIILLMIHHKLNTQKQPT